MKPKIIALYLPQFHQIPENDEFWGEGFTDWVTVKNAKPLFDGHQQPKVPLNDNYYDLSIKENIEWQAMLAKEYGIYGFGIYHYWFNNEKNLLTKPVEIILENKDINLRFFFAWDNSNWKRSWSNVEGNPWVLEGDSKPRTGSPILIPYILGNEDDWMIHYNAVKIYFADSRYIKKDNKPVFVIFNYSKEIGKMCSYWNTLALKDGFSGIHFVFRYDKRFEIPNNQYKFKYEPLFSGMNRGRPLFQRVCSRINRFMGIEDGPRILSYDKVWGSILKNAKMSKDPFMYHGAFVSYDDTPRRGRKGSVIKEASAHKFKNYLYELSSITEIQNKDFIFLTAWNEWGEGACLEPDKENGFSYLEALSKIDNK